MVVLPAHMLARNGKGKEGRCRTFVACHEVFIAASSCRHHSVECLQLSPSQSVCADKVFMALNHLDANSWKLCRFREPRAFTSVLTALSMLQHKGPRLSKSSSFLESVYNLLCSLF